MSRRQFYHGLVGTTVSGMSGSGGSGAALAVSGNGADILAIPEWKATEASLQDSRARNQDLFERVIKKSLHRWRPLTKGNADVYGHARKGDYVTTLPARYHNGTSFVNVTTWASGLSVGAGTIVQPSTQNGFFYEVISPGDGTTANPPPSFSLILGADTTGASGGGPGTIVYRTVAPNVVSMNVDLRRVAVPYMPVRWMQRGDESYKYAVIIGLNSVEIGLAGAPMSATASLENLMLGRPEAVVQLSYHFADSYSNGTAPILLHETYSQRYEQWLRSRAYFCLFMVRHRVNAGTENPYVNWRIDGGYVSLDSGGLGRQPGTAWAAARPTLVDISEYNIDPLDEIDVVVKRVGNAAGTAQDLSTAAVFVLE